MFSPILSCSVTGKDRLVSEIWGVCIWEADDGVIQCSAFLPEAINPLELLFFSSVSGRRWFCSECPLL